MHDLAGRSQSLIWTLPGVFLGFLFVLIIKFRKSPFDLSMSHHAHQELVRGITTEFSGSALAMIEVSHWFENILLLGWVYLFFTSSPVLGIAAVLAVYLFVILVDNTFARLKWQTMVKGTWAVTLVLGFGNIMILSFR
ncbi:MAG: NADH-quinone oxidoreductase subunit H [Opitutaceae bacterium]